MPIRKISIKITRRESDGIYQIQSMTGAANAYAKEQHNGSEDVVRVGDDVSEAEVKSLCDRYHNVTITRIKG